MGNKPKPGDRINGFEPCPPLQVAREASHYQEAGWIALRHPSPHPRIRLQSLSFVLCSALANCNIITISPALQVRLWAPPHYKKTKACNSHNKLHTYLLSVYFHFNKAWAFPALYWVLAGGKPTVPAHDLLFPPPIVKYNELQGILR